MDHPLGSEHCKMNMRADTKTPKFDSSIECDGGKNYT